MTDFYVQVTRKAAPNWWHRPWREVVAAADDDAIPDVTLRDPRMSAPPTDHAWLREARDRADFTLLYMQNW